MKAFSPPTALLLLPLLSNVQAECATTAFSNECLADLNITHGQVSAEIPNVFYYLENREGLGKYFSSFAVCTSNTCFQEVQS
jgi:hypothetical protein